MLVCPRQNLYFVVVRSMTLRYTKLKKRIQGCKNSDSSIWLMNTGPQVVHEMLSKSDIRANFRRKVFNRDKYRCVTCGVPETDVEKLDAHHITDRNDMPNGGYVMENGISLCPPCHLKAEIYHQTNGWNWGRGFHPNTLYFLIGSSPQEAREASQVLCKRSQR